MKGNAHSKSKLEHMQAHYALAKELYNKQHKNILEIKCILKEKGLHIETAEVIVKDVEMYAEIQAKTEARNILFFGVILLVCSILLVLMCVVGSFQNETAALILIVPLTLTGFVLCLYGIIPSFIKKRIS